MAWNNSNTTSSKWLDITPSKDGGVLKRIIIHGEKYGGIPSLRSTVEVRYIGKLLNGVVIDSGIQYGRDAFRFTLGVGKVIKGLDIGVATMRKKEKCQLKIRGDYAYGKRGSPPKVGPNETLMVEISLLRFSGLYQKKERANYLLPTEAYVLNTILKDGEMGIENLLFSLENAEKEHLNVRIEVKSLYFKYLVLYGRYGIGKPKISRKLKKLELYLQSDRLSSANDKKNVKLTINSFQRAERLIERREFEDAVLLLQETVKIDERSFWMNAKCYLLIVAIKVITKKYKEIMTHVTKALSDAPLNFKNKVGSVLFYIRAIATLQHGEVNRHKGCVDDLHKCLEMGTGKLGKKSMALISKLETECLKRQSVAPVNLYEILGVVQYAPIEDIKRAYKKLAFKHHPDRCSPERKKDCVEMIEKINAAKDVLFDVRKRFKYDLKLQFWRKASPSFGFGAMEIPLQPFWDDIERILKELNVFRPNTTAKIRAVPTTNGHPRNSAEELRPAPAPKPSFKKELLLMRRKYEDTTLNDFKILEMLGESEYFSIPCFDFICQLNGEELLLKIAKNEIIPGAIRPPLEKMLQLVRRPAMEIGHNAHVVSCLKMWEEKVDYSRLPGLSKYVKENQKAGEETGLFLFKHYRKTLRDLKKERKGKFSEEDYIQIVKQVLEGAYHLEFSKIVHKCLTLDNVFVGDEGGKNGNFVLKIGNFGKAMDVSRVKNFKVYISKEQLPYYDFGEISKYPEREHFFGNEEFNFRHCGVFSVGLLCHDLISHTFKEERSVWGRKTSDEIPLYSTTTRQFVHSLTAPARISLKESLEQCRMLCSTLSGTLDLPPSESGDQQSPMNGESMEVMEAPQGRKKKKYKKSSGKGFEWPKPNEGVMTADGFSLVQPEPSNTNPWKRTWESARQEDLIESDEKPVEIDEMDLKWGVCPLSKEEYDDPVKLPRCGHIFSRNALIDYLNRFGTFTCAIKRCFVGITAESVRSLRTEEQFVRSLQMQKDYEKFLREKKFESDCE